MIPNHINDTLEWLAHIEDFQTARSLALTVFKRLPKDRPESTDFVAKILNRCKFYKEAVVYAKQTLEFLPNDPNAQFNYAKCLNSAGLPEQAEIYMRKVCEAVPEWADSKIDLSVYIASTGRRDEAQKILEDLQMQIPPDSHNAKVIRFNLGWHYIRGGDFKTGMKYLGIGRELRIWGARSLQYPKPMLQPGMDLRQKTVLLVGEGGAGDEIINVRFAKVIQERGGKCVWISHQNLSSLFSRMASLSNTYENTAQKIPTYDYWAPAMDLPALLDLDIHEIPNQPYLTADKLFEKKWKKIIPPSRRLKVGLRWQGNTLYEQDLMRSIHFSELEKLTEISGIEFYSLQRDSAVDQIPPGSKVVDLSEKLETWEDAAAAIMQLDLVISTCTSIPHLSAALGVKTWLLCPLNMYYLWCTPGDNSPWYSSLRLYRQQKLNDWTVNMVDIHRDLQELVARKNEHAGAPVLDAP